ncbi:MAG: SEC-C domain-containing protein, partial [Candidatus Eisenbacteria bacterium]|nr:SEC-C domain-containing protein [Candidatus Eisenbacteria bacterium]
MSMMGSGITVGAHEMSFLSKMFGKKPPKEAARLGRNEACWCGSGKKYKRCHYEADRVYFSAQ